MIEESLRDGSFGRRDVALAAILFAVTLGTSILVAHAGAASAGMPLGSLAVYFDGHLYLEIAKSFPIPYAPEGRDYAGQAPGYPAAIYFLRQVVPHRLADWGILTLLTSWLASSFASVVFYVCCRRMSQRALLPALLFTVGNPIWISISATAHAESLAMLFALLAFLAVLDNRPLVSMTLLSCAVLTRFPALLLTPVYALGLFVAPRRARPALLVEVLLPVAALALLNLYLSKRIPGFVSVWETHRVFWKAHLTVPFLAFLQADYESPWLEIGTLGVYVASVLLAVWSGRRDLRILALWVLVIVVVHASIDGHVTLRAFPRLTVLAWPAAVLIWWQAVGRHVPAAAMLMLCCALGSVGVPFATNQIIEAKHLQDRIHPFLPSTIEALDSDQPRWVQFRRPYRVRRQSRP